MGIKHIFFVSFLLLILTFIWGYLDIYKGITKVDNCVPFNTEIKKEQEEIEIVWETESECTGYVRYGYNLEDLNLVSVGKTIKSKDHVVAITRDEGVQYYLIVVSDESIYGIDGEPLVVSKN